MAHNEKFLSLVLRHKPEALGISLDESGWVAVTELLEGLKKHNRQPATEEALFELVQKSSKKRFEYDITGSRIRACQGHSVEIDLGLKPLEPPVRLYHGTIPDYIPSILSKGLIKGSRQHVHLSEDRDTAKTVGSRRGTPVLLTILAQDMRRAGYEFYRSTNGVWLTDHVPPDFLR
jgi:putative RNA 2'-phosphotransferase